MTEDEDEDEDEDQDEDEDDDEDEDEDVMTYTTAATTAMTDKIHSAIRWGKPIPEIDELMGDQIDCQDEKKASIVSFEMLRVMKTSLVRLSSPGQSFNCTGS